MSPKSLRDFLEKETFIHNDGYCQNKTTRNLIKACVPMHTFGHAARIRKYQIFAKNIILH